MKHYYMLQHEVYTLNDNAKKELRTGLTEIRGTHRFASCGCLRSRRFLVQLFAAFVVAAAVLWW